MFVKLGAQCCTANVLFWLKGFCTAALLYHLWAGVLSRTAQSDRCRACLALQGSFRIPAVRRLYSIWIVARRAERDKHAVWKQNLFELH
jgi:hypothetical protein